MTDWQLLLLGVALGAVPSARLGRIFAAALAKRLGLKPREIAQYDEAADGED
jgi:hypothetical protein